MHSVHRRQFLKLGAAAALLTPAQGVEPIHRVGKPNLRTSLAAYSFRDFFTPGGKMDMFRFVDYCADHGLQGAELTSYYFDKEVSDDFLLKVRRHAFLRGIECSGTAIGNEFGWPKGPERDREIAAAKAWVDRAAVLGAPHIRVFAGVVKGAHSAADAKKRCIEALEETCDHAGKKGIFLGLENHGGMVAEAPALLEIVQAVKSPWLGVNLDTGNFNTDDPYGDLAKCAPYAVNVQVKVEIAPRGQQKSPADLERLVKILRDSNYQGYVALEYEAAEDPFVAVPPALEKLKALCAG